jgi:2-polyprenyl-6-methoxyphenol hydroxylase-like FAD-dependent oxidoreductase
MDTDVLVVGAGPTGLMLANQLVRRGVRTVIIDRHAGPARETRARGVQARTLEIYAKLGIDQRARTSKAISRNACASRFGGGAAQGITTEIFPTVRPVSLARCASAIWSSG